MTINQSLSMITFATPRDSDNSGDYDPYKNRVPHFLKVGAIRSVVAN
jgi:hypothetical protein